MSSSDSDANGMQTVRTHPHDRGAVNGRSCNMTNYYPEMSPPTMLNQERHRTRNGTLSIEQPRDSYRRETSPMSFYSVPNVGMQSYSNNNFYISSARNEIDDRMSRCPSVISGRCPSIISGRCPSAASGRSITSNLSTISAIDITWAIENMKFNEDEWKLMQHAFQKQIIKKKLYNQIKRRRMIKLNRQKRKNDFVDITSMSSLSDDDGDVDRSVLSTQRPSKPASVMSAKIDIPQFKDKINECGMVQNCSEKMKQKHVYNNTGNRTFSATLNNTNSEASQSTMTSLSLRFQKSSFRQTDKLSKSAEQTANTSIIQNQSLKDRFSTKSKQTSGSSMMQNRPLQKIIEQEKSIESDNEEIFHATVMENTQYSNGKRAPDNNADSREYKKPKTMTTIAQNNPNSKQTSDFKFKTPLLPRKSNNKKVVVPEIVISTSQKSQNGTNTLNGKLDEQSILDNQHKIVNSTEIENTANQTTTENTTVASKSSFSKRKLFTQKLDVAEQRNVNSDTDANTPAKLHNGKERNKVRKLVTSQPCLSRELTDSNATTALIHKLVGKEDINKTMNKKQVNKSGPDDEKWDVTSIMSMCDDSDVSATFTDEEIFNVAPSKKEVKNTEKTKKCDAKNEAPTKSNTGDNVRECQVVLAKIYPPAPSTSGTNKNQPIKKTAESILRSFWDTDSEWEEMPATSNNIPPGPQTDNGAAHKRQTKNTIFNSRWKSCIIDNTSHVNKDQKENLIQNNIVENSPSGQRLTKVNIEKEIINGNLNKNNKQVNVQKDTLKKKIQVTKLKSVSSTKLKKVQSKMADNNKPTKLNTSRESQRLKERKQQNQSASMNVSKTCSENDLTTATRRRTRQSKENVKPISQILGKQGNKREKNNNNSDSSGNLSGLNKSKFGRIRRVVKRFNTSYDN